MRKILYQCGIAAFAAASFAPSLMMADATPPNSFESPAAGLLPPAAATEKILPMRITAYSSSVDETDGTPFITANGARVRDGIVATNLLPFGTKIKIPSLFGGKVFVVEDRMARRMKDVIDVWMPSKNAALRFGVNYANIVVLAPSNLSFKL